MYGLTAGCRIYTIASRLGHGAGDLALDRDFMTAAGWRCEHWLQRQTRKVNGGFQAFEELAKSKPKDSDYLFADQLTIADIAVVCAASFVDFNGFLPDWKEKHPALAAYWSKIDQRESFASTRPVMFDIKPDVVV